MPEKFGISYIVQQVSHMQSKSEPNSEIVAKIGMTGSVRGHLEAPPSGGGLWRCTVGNDEDKIYSNTIVEYSPDGQLLPSMSPDLDERELFAIGAVTANWSLLEHFILAQTAEMAQARKAEIPADAFNLSFGRRYAAWLAEVRQLANDDADKKRLESLAGKISNCENLRHKVTHGLWEWEISNPDKLRAFSTRPRVEFEMSTDFDALIKLARAIGEINFCMTYPGGKDQFDEARAKVGASMSRSFIRAATKGNRSP
jgi:hypothetical protein